LAKLNIVLSHFVPSIQRLSNNLYANNLPPQIKSCADLEALFSPYGKISSSALKESKIVKNGKVVKFGYFGFVNFENIEDATKAKDELNNKEIEGCHLLVSKYMSKALRANEKLRKNLELKRKIVYLSNFPENATDEQLKEAFSRFGNLINLTRDPKKTLAVAYAHFNTIEEASIFVVALSKGKEAGVLPFPTLVYALLQAKSERRHHRVRELRGINEQFYQPPRYPMQPQQIMGQQNMYQQRAKRPENRKKPYPQNPMAMQMMGPRMPGHPMMNPMMGQQPIMPQQMAPQQMMNSQAMMQQSMMQSHGMMPQQQMMAMYMMPQMPRPTMVNPNHPQMQLQPQPQPHPQPTQGPMQTKEQVGERIYNFMLSLQYPTDKSSKITGMLLELEPKQLSDCCNDVKVLKKFILEAEAMLTQPSKENQE